MKALYKYPMNIADINILTTKSDDLLGVMEQRGGIVIYSIHDDDEEENTFEIAMFGIGQVARNILDYKFLGMVSLCDGNYIQHVFYRKKPEVIG